MMVRTWRIAAMVIVCVAGVVGCKSKKAGALESFAKKYNCPEGSITVKERPDLSWAEIVTSNLPVNVSVKSSGVDEGIMEVEGCGHHDFLVCRNPETQFSTKGAGGVRSTRTGKNLAAMACTHHSIDEAEREAAKRAEKDAKKIEKAAEKEVKRAEKEAKKAEKAANKAAK